MEHFDDEDEDDEEEWDTEDDEDEGWGDEEEEEEMDSIPCRCGETIWITTDKRPYRFECEKCGRTGTLK